MSEEVFYKNTWFTVTVEETDKENEDNQYDPEKLYVVTNFRTGVKELYLPLLVEAVSAAQEMETMLVDLIEAGKPLETEDNVTAFPKH